MTYILICTIVALVYLVGGIVAVKFLRLSRRRKTTAFEEGIAFIIWPLAVPLAIGMSFANLAGRIIERFGRLLQRWLP